MAEDVRYFNVMWPTECPAVVTVEGWSGNLADALNDIPSGAWNDFLFATMRPVFDAQGHPLVSLTGSRWVSYGGVLALSFQIGVDPVDIPAIVGALTIAGAFVLAGLDGLIASFNPPVALVFAALVVGGILVWTGPIVTEVSPVAASAGFLILTIGVVAVGGAIAYAYFTKEGARKNINEAASGLYSGAGRAAKGVYSTLRGE